MTTLKHPYLDASIIPCENCLTRPICRQHPPSQPLRCSLLAAYTLEHIRYDMSEVKRILGKDVVFLNGDQIGFKGIKPKTALITATQERKRHEKIDSDKETSEDVPQYKWYTGR